MTNSSGGFRVISEVIRTLHPDSEFNAYNRGLEEADWERVAREMVEAAERDGRLSSAGTVVEYTAGTTGISLALVCAAKGYRLKIVFSDAFSEEKGR